MTLTSLRDQADSGPTPSKSSTSAAPTSNYYCLDNKHGPVLLTEDRFFYWDPADAGCPTCPICNKQVNAQAVAYNAKGQPQIPSSLLALADRIGERV